MCRILIVSRPIAPPWDEGSKNIVYGIAKYSKRIAIHILSNENFNKNLGSNIVVEKIYRGNSSSVAEKMRLFMRLIKKDDIEIYHFFFHPTKTTSFISRRISRHKKKRTIQTIPSMFKENNSIDKLSNIIFGEKLVVFSNYMKKTLESNGFENIIKINPGIEIDKFKPSQTSSELKTRYDIKKNEKVVLYAGNYNKNMGIETLKKSIERVCKSNSEIKFIMACRTENRSEYNSKIRFFQDMEEKGLQKNIVYLNTIDRMDELMGVIDVCIFPAENMYGKLDIPLVLLESLSMEKPIVISDVKPLNELMDEDVGYMIKSRDHEMLSQKILELMNDDSKREKKGIRGRILVKNNYDISKITFQYEKLYLNVLEQT